MYKNQYYRITKLGAAKNNLYPTADKKDYVCGQVNENVSPFKGYEVEGYLLSEIELNKSVLMDRRFRNSVKIDGFFQTSPVKSINLKNNTFTTENSVYKFEKVKEKP